MERVDCLFINPSALSQIYQSLAQTLTAVEPPIWAALLAQSVRAKGKTVSLLDCEGEGLTVAEAVKRAGAITPKLTVIVVYGQQPSASTQNMHAASLLCSAYKEAYPDRKVLLVGGHVSALPERTLGEESADFVAKGEGLYTILGLLDGGAPEGIPGLYWQEEGKLRRGAEARLIPQEALATELPGMAWDLLPMKNYRAHNWHAFGSVHERSPYASVYTSLGCPFRCSFCCINAPFGQSSFRHWDPDFMIGQFDLLAEKYQVRHIKIADEMFVLKQDHFMKLAHLLAERRHGFNIWAYSRIDTVKPEYLDTLKRAGVNWLALGIESGSKHVRDGVAKGRFDSSQIRTVVKSIQDAGIHVIGNYIFGLPDDTFETMQETLDLALELNCEMANFYSAMAYPGSRLFTLAQANGWALPDSWLGYSQHSYDCLPLPTEHLSAGEVLGFRDYAFHRYFEDRGYLRSIREKFGAETEAHLRDMTLHRLRRKYAVAPKEAHRAEVRL